MKRIFLDYASATPLGFSSKLAMAPFYDQLFYNPSALYQEARLARQKLELAREQVAKILGSRPSEIIFTAGATESINLAIRGVMDKHDKAEIIVSSIEHAAVLDTAKRYNYKLAKVDKNGKVDIDDLKKQITDKTALVSIMMANNEIGTIQPIREIADIVEKERKNRKTHGNKLPILLHSDGAQAPNLLSVQLSYLGVDMLSLNGGKIYGPKQSGILYVRAGVELVPQITGGDQEFGLRSGTENVAQIIGFAEALLEAQKLKNSELKRLAELKKYLIEGLKRNIDNVVFNGHKTDSLVNIVNFSLLGCDSEWLVMAFDQAGLMVSAGSACGASKDGPSHVLLAIGLSEAEANSSIRISMGRQTTKAELDYAIKQIVQKYKEYRELLR